MTEVRPKQLRALLLLLVLVPLIPLALMARFMADTLRVERIAAQDRAEQLHSAAVEPLLREYTPEPGADRALIERVKNGGDPNITARVVDAGGALLAGEPAPWGQPLVTGTLPDGATLQIHLAGPHVLDDAVREQRNFLIGIGALAALLVLAIAGTAALALNRQIALSELRNTSVATVAHELRTPLASMRMLVDTLREGRYRSDAQLREYLDLVAAENERLTRLAENFLTFSRLERGAQPLNTTAVAPADIIAQAVAPLRTRLDAGKFTLNAPELPKVRADRDALAQVLTNLLDNALKYTGDEKRIALRSRVEGARVVFEVEDNGIGIPAAQRGEIFRPFFQVDQKLSRSREGCGLGLAIVRRIVDAHGGEISVASAPDGGSIFTVKIPLA